MTTLPPLNIPSLLKKYNLKPSQGLGQNFLVDDLALQDIVRVAEISPTDEVLEIGSGLGNLTRHLAFSAQSVVALELDMRMMPALQEVLSAYPNVRLVQGDILKLDPASLMEASEYVVVANIPYYITSAVIRHLLESSRRPRKVTLTIQQEVAERICARPGEMSLLALSVQVYGSPQIMARIPAAAFFPAPKVDSAVLVVEIYPQPVIASPKLNTFFRLAKAGFSQKRKTLRNSLSAGMHTSPQQASELLTACGIDPQRRAETLSLEEWNGLCAQFLALGD
jgi:16S rRNA (adenine1518-N6/adenine1519-N6)-dimethyltransferase